MFGTRFPLFRVFGISVQVDLSWFIIVLLITWSLATAVFPSYVKDLPLATYWWMGLAGALGLFASILLHELAHSLVARWYGLPIKGITLFIFGGVAEMTQEPPNAKVEFLVAIAGPIASVLIAVGCFGLAAVGQASGGWRPVIGVTWYLGMINSLLVVFNLIPAFPLDGGRVLRSVLWQMRGNLKWATRVASSFGNTFGLVLIVLGVLSIVTGNFVGGMWQCLIGVFLRGAAQMSYQQLLVRRALEGESVSRFMQRDVHAVAPSITIADLVEDYIYRQHHKMYPVLDGGRLIGCVTMRRVKEVPQDQWDVRRVGEILEPCSPANTIEPQADAIQALGRMSENQSSRLMVLDGGRLCGVVTLKDLMNFISLKVELEDDGASSRKDSQGCS